MTVWSGQAALGGTFAHGLDAIFESNDQLCHKINDRRPVNMTPKMPLRRPRIPGLTPVAPLDVEYPKPERDFWGPYNVEWGQKS